MVTASFPLLESPLIRKGSKVFVGVGSVLLHVFPSMKRIVDQAGIKDDYAYDAREYLAVVFFVSAFVFIISGGLMTFLLVAGDAELPILGPVVGTVMGVGAFFSLMFYPVTIVNARVKYIERNLLFSVRSLLIQIRSGVPLFYAMGSIAVGNYGEVSTEFKKVVEKVNSGVPTKEALEELANRNPSNYFRRVLWQIVNSMNSGSDVGNNLQELLKSLAKEQLVEISRYKSILNPLAMMYMMVAVIAPSLGITMLIILSFFPGMEALADERVFWGLLGFTILMQFIFMGIIKAKRPNLIGG